MLTGMPFLDGQAWHSRCAVNVQFFQYTHKKMYCTVYGLSLQQALNLLTNICAKAMAQAMAFGLLRLKPEP